MLNYLTKIIVVSLISIFSISIYAKTFNEHVDSYCEGVRFPNTQPQEEFAEGILILAKERQLVLDPTMLAHFPSLVYLLVLMNKETGKAQEYLDNLDSLDASSRIELCRKLEMERLENFVKLIKPKS